MGAGDEGQGSGCCGNCALGGAAAGKYAYADEADEDAGAGGGEGDAVVVLGKGEAFAGLVEYFVDDLGVEVCHGRDHGFSPWKVVIVLGAWGLSGGSAGKDGQGLSDRFPVGIRMS